MQDFETNITIIPPHCREGLIEYIRVGRPVGSFLTAVLSNDLREAFSRADDENLHALIDYVKYLYNYAPSQCWGSPSKVTRWIEIGGLAGDSRRET